MRIVELRWTPYALPFRDDVTTAHGGWRVREGAIVRLRTDTELIGIGDIAPLPSHGTRSNVECLSILEGIAQRLLGMELDDAGSLIDEMVEGVGYAPVRSGIGIAALDAKARAAGVGLAHLLSPDAAREVAVSALIDAAPAGEACAASARAVAYGFRDVKLKAGVESSFANEVARVAAVREAIGSATRLRLDANGAWTEQQAIDTIRAVERYGIELVEQPVAAGNVAALRRVREAVRTPVAADESVTGIDAVRALIDARAVDAIVVKLPVAGGLLAAREMCRIAADADVETIVTSAFESGAGVAAALQLAAALPRPARASGLATLDLLADDLIVERLCITCGRMALPDTVGIGVTLDEEALARYGAGPERVVRA